MIHKLLPALFSAASITLLAASKGIAVENKQPTLATSAAGRMMRLSKEVFIRHQNKRPPATGFITYNDSPRVQMSNFLFYQDRESGDVVIFLTRYGEASEKEWMLANYYRYRVEIP